MVLLQSAEELDTTESDVEAPETDGVYGNFLKLNHSLTRESIQNVVPKHLRASFGKLVAFQTQSL